MCSTTARRPHICVIASTPSHCGSSNAQSEGLCHLGSPERLDNSSGDRMNNHRISLLFPLAVAAILLACWSAYAAEADALAISANIQARHIPSDSVSIIDPVYASGASNQIVGYTRCGDSALWTG